MNLTKEADGFGGCTSGAVCVGVGGGVGVGCFLGVDGCIGTKEGKEVDLEACGDALVCVGAVEVFPAPLSL